MFGVFLDFCTYVFDGFQVLFPIYFLRFDKMFCNNHKSLIRMLYVHIYIRPHTKIQHHNTQNTHKIS